MSIITIGGRQMVWCSLNHPARNWGQLKRNYLKDVAAPALDLTRQLALDL